MIDWFSEWFDSKYYHILYKNRNEKEAESFLENLSILEFFKKNSKIIDIACGKGRHSFFLSELGYDVTGVDLSKNSIKHAQQFEKENLKFDVADMRETYKKNSFDVSLNLFTSFGYFNKKEDDFSAIKAMSENLKNDGILIIDFLNSKKVISNLIKTETKEINGIQFNISRKVKDGFIIKNIEVNHNEDKFYFQEKVKALTKENFSELLTFAGLQIINTFGNYKLDKFNYQTSDRLILICKK
ncbi:MAG: class I SAM-dependent methyltransferase [Flavobacteriales bacterium]